jgi:hypothetical protein
MYQCLACFIKFLDIPRWIAIDLGKRFKTNKKDKSKLMITGQNSYEDVQESVDR